MELTCIYCPLLQVRKLRAREWKQFVQSQDNDGKDGGRGEEEDGDDDDIDADTWRSPEPGTVVSA